MLTLNEILKNKMSNLLIYKKCKNKDLTFLFPQLETYIEVLNNMGIEFEYSLKFEETLIVITQDKDKITEDELFYLQLLINGHIPFTFKDDCKDFYKFIKYTPYLKVTLHFPKFIIKNNLNHKSEIKDFFVRFYIDKNGKIKDNSLEASRTTYTNNEIKAGYRHSHLQSCSSGIMGQFIRFTTMCLGNNNQIHISMAYLNDAVIKNENISEFFELFIRNIISVIEYESIEGTPYIKMSRIKEVATQNKLIINPYNVYYKANRYVIDYLGNTYINMLHSFLFHYDNCEQLEFNDESENIIFDEIISNHLDSIKLDPILKSFIKVEVNNRLLNLDEIEIVSESKREDYYVEFNDKKYYLTIDDTVKLEDNNFKYVLLPIFKNYVKQIIKTKYIHRISITKKDYFTLSESNWDSSNPPF